jgi:hypothetical protein
MIAQDYEAELERKDVQIRRLREVLQFYATQLSGGNHSRIIEQDKGRRAREALAREST